MSGGAIPASSGMKGEKMKVSLVPIAVAFAVLAAPLLSQGSEIPKVAQAPAVMPSAGPSQPMTGIDPEVEVAFWNSVKDSDDPMLYLAYLEQYPDGAFRVIARNRLVELWDRAVRAFALLEDLGISVDGPPATAASPLVAPAPAQSAPTVVRPPVVVQAAPVEVKPQTSPTRIRNAQRQLKKHGCYSGAIDGIWGVGSKAAMRRFNRLAGTDFSVPRPNSEAITYMRDLSRAGVRICR